MIREIGNYYLERVAWICQCGAFSYNPNWKHRCKKFRIAPVCLGSVRIRSLSPAQVMKIHKMKDEPMEETK